MSMIGLKIKDRTYDRLKWLKTRFEFVHETTMSWDEFFDRISRDVLLILAHDLREKNGGKVSAEDIFSILVGNKGIESEKSEGSELFSMISSDAFQQDEFFNSLSSLKGSARKNGSARSVKE